MLRNNLGISIRQLTKNKSFSVINLTGLIAGITVCLFVVQFVWFEYSFERFNANADRTYRMNLYNTSNGVFDNIYSGTVSGLAYAMEQTLPGIESVGRLSSKARGIVVNKENNTSNLESEIVFGDPSIAGILGIDIIAGSSAGVLADVHSVIISESIARKYFGESSAVGKVLEIGFDGSSSDVKPYQVQAVFKDIPPNTHQHFDLLLRPQNEPAWNENWSWSDVSTYVQLQDGIGPQDLDQGLASIVKQHHRDNTGDRYLLEPITDIRLKALDGSGRATIVNSFIILGSIILLLAWFNYVSLSTARFLERMKEVGIRKLAGASRKQLVIQFLSESFLFNTISFSVSLVSFMVSWPMLAPYLQMPPQNTFLSEQMTFIFLPLSIAAGTLLSGFYPSLFLSSFKPLESVKGKLGELTDRSTLRKALAVVQLSVSVFLISALFTIKGQLDFMRTRELGISIDRMLIIDEPLLHDESTLQKFEPFRNEILSLPSIDGITYASSFPGAEIDWHRTDITLGAEDAGFHFNSRIIAIGTEFLDVFSIPLLSGRNFRQGDESDRKTMLINEEASKMFGFKDPGEALGKSVFVGNRRFEVIGVIKNYHFRSFQYSVQPLLFMMSSPSDPHYAIRIGSTDMAGTISNIKTKWEKTYTGNVFSFHFLDDQFDRQYASEERTAVIVGYLAFLALIISTLGVFGLSLYSVSRRSKEIGIRKVFGASVINVVILISGDFVKLITISGIVAIPFIYQGITTWLSGYAHQMPLDISLFMLPLGIVAILTLFTISFQTMTAAKANPIDSIRHD